jgi:pimeloyl-ACP methyl ester carboxylesterase
VFLHGAPGSRKLLRARDVADARARYLCPDRPGYGFSSPHPGRTIVDFARDVIELVDALGIDRFVVAGTSGGCPYAEAVAWLAPDRVRALGIVAGMGPPSAAGDEQKMPALRRFALGLVRRHPSLSRPLAAIEASRVDRLLRGGVAKLVEELASRSPDADRALLAEPDTFASYVETYAEAWRQGSRGYAQDLALLVKPWGFALEEIRVPTWLWHGEADNVTPIAMGRHVARAIPGCRAKFLAGEAHLLRLAHWPEIVGTLLGEIGSIEASARG